MTWRRSVHTTADDPRVYRSEEEEKAWEGRDPIPRLRGYLQRLGRWDAAKEAALVADVDRDIATGFDAAVAYRDGNPDPLEIFDHVFAEIPPMLVKQRAEAEAWIGGRRIVVGAGKATTKPGGAAAVGELEEAEEVPGAPAPSATPAAPGATIPSGRNGSDGSKKGGAR